MTVTYRFGVTIYGANYPQSDPTDPANVVMVESLTDARALLRDMHDGVAWGIDGAGKKIRATRGYGYTGDGAIVYRVRPSYGTGPDDVEQQARDAFSRLDTAKPTHMFQFGQYGSISLRAWPKLLDGALR